MSYASDRGLTVGSKIKTLEESDYFGVNEILTMVKYNGIIPDFRSDESGEVHPFCITREWEHYKEEEKDMTFELEVGDKVEIISTGIFREGMVKIGDIATYDGSYFSCPTWEDTQCCTKDLWSKYLKPYVAAKPKTPFEQAGYTKETKFKVLEAQYGFRKGEIVTLDWDDQSSCPRFKSEGGNTAFIFFSTTVGHKTGLEVYVEESEADNTHTLKFPCCVATSEIKDEETFQKILDLFVANGAEVSDRLFSDKGNWNWFGVDVNDLTTEYYNSVSSYATDYEEKDVTVYTAEELLAMTPKEETPLITVVKDVTYSVGIKGTLFTFTQDELNELVSELQGFEDYE